jgi:hypothetical protein
MGLPYRPFFYTLDQVADIFQVSDVSRYLHYDMRSPGVRSLDKLLAVNIAPEGTQPEWRVEEQELLRWMHHKGFGAMVRINQLR